MVINRHNYEEFFLLYVDNELNEADRAEVEKFVQENTDLAAEMDMLKQAVLPGDNVRFEQKELLYNNEKGISPGNYEEYFLLALDKELTLQEMEEVEKFVLKHPQLQNEYTVLSQTKLDPEAITFEGKEKLYKKYKDRPVIFMTWMRISAAAAIIGFVTLAWFFTQNNELPFRSQLMSKTDKITHPLPGQLQQQPLLIDNNVPALAKKAPVRSEPIAAVKFKTKKADEPKPATNVTVAGNKKSKPQEVETPRKVVDEIDIDTPDRKLFEETIASAKIAEKSNLPVAREDVAKVKLVAKSSSEQGSPSLASHAVYREIDNQENDEENTFYIGSAEINKTKLKGLFKKAASLFERKSNENEGERTLKIAGFEIKSK
ncbi:hypothetical protein [Segetibacter sp.]|uniref:anti-sigma factor family protein n=1 Tax=Segetibacter sp. TaxID=2231182 RepID=UPI0026254D24|nr:hypothetical protein [Segetibacter sp.]MCW3082290.1 hypothetical protein [Segetibacter sp.]